MRPGSPEGQEPDPSEEEPAEPITAAEWHVDRSLMTFKIIGALAFALVPQVLGLNAASRWFGVVVAIVLAIYALRDVAAPVRLAADAEGVTVVSGYSGHRRLAWSEIDRLRVDSRRRAEFLEVDANESLHLFSRYDLGMPPTEALEMLEQIRPSD